MMVRRDRTAKEMRFAAARRARVAADDRERDGDPEGAGVLRDLAREISRIRLTTEERA